MKLLKAKKIKLIVMNLDFFILQLMVASSINKVNVNNELSSSFSYMGDGKKHTVYTKK